MKIKTKKWLGQNFLKNKKILKFLANSLPDIHNNIVIEIGGGTGNLTQFLTSAKKLLVYEIDKFLVDILKRKFKNYKNVKILKTDFLNSKLNKFNHNYLLIGNIPYFITGKILRKIFNINNFPKLAIITLQKEYGEKILGKDGNNFLHSWIRVFAQPNKVMIIKKQNFYPAPQVDSIALKFNFYTQPLIKDLNKFEKFLKNLFRFNNKTILNNLKFNYDEQIIKKINADFSKKRPHQLTFDEIIKLFNLLEYNEKNN